jgi:hypothetical protein
MTTALGSGVSPQAVEQPTPKAEPDPTGKQSVERVEGDIAELRSPAHCMPHMWTAPSSQGVLHNWLLACHCPPRAVP